MKFYFLLFLVVSLILSEKKGGFSLNMKEGARMSVGVYNLHQDLNTGERISYNNFPVYRKEGDQVYLYFKDQQWRIGATLGGDQAYAYNPKAVFAPPREKWHFAENNQ